MLKAVWRRQSQSSDTPRGLNPAPEPNSSRECAEAVDVGAELTFQSLASSRNLCLERSPPGRRALSWVDFRVFLSIQGMQNSSPLTPLWEQKIQIPISGSASVVFKSANIYSLSQQHGQPGGAEIVQAEGSVNTVYPEFYSQFSRAPPSSQDRSISNSLGRALSLKKEGMMI